ncbi:MAG TPA: hypothetical protein VFZ21_04150 [Gemmatimonadaceae bacterium]|nr:hypothetical protein [Gemmatimonadaceae bacterium]
MMARHAGVWATVAVFLAGMRAVEMRINAWAVGGATELGAPNVIFSLAAAAAIHTGVIVWLATRSRLPDPARLLGLIGVGIGFGIANNLEAVVFGIAPAAALIGLAVLGALAHTGAVIVVARVIPATPNARADVASPFAGWSVGAVAIRVLGLGIAYTIIYFAAGAVIYPFVRDFYANKPLPSTGALVALQTLVRGPIFAGIGALVIALLRSTRLTHAVAVGCTLAGLGGLTALLVPNPLFPDAVRHVHLAEVGTSNFVFGWIVGWVMSGAQRVRTRSVPAVEGAAAPPNEC